MTVQEIKDFVYSFFRAKGFPHKTVIAIMGNIDGENTAWSVTQEEISGGGGYGLCQWTDTYNSPRRSNLERYVNERGEDELLCQCEYLYMELTGENDNYNYIAMQWISTPSTIVTQQDNYYFSLNDFINGIGTIEELTLAFTFCFERPQYSETSQETRIQGAMAYDSYYLPNNKTVIDKVVETAINIANDDIHGYDQKNRWGVDYDCSSFVITCFEESGILLKSLGATYTGDLANVCLNNGFKNVINEVDTVSGKGIQKGDIILASTHHVTLAISDTQVASATLNELGTVTGGESGDQSGTEIYVSDYYTFDNIDYVLRYEKGSDIYEPTLPTTKKSIYELLLKTSYNIRQLDSDNITTLKNLYLNSYVNVLHNFNKSKKSYGKDFFGKKLLFSSLKQYIINDVSIDGFILLQGSNKKPPFKINPKFIEKR